MVVLFYISIVIYCLVFTAELYGIFHRNFDAKVKFFSEVDYYIAFFLVIFFMTVFIKNDLLYSFLLLLFIILLGEILYSGQRFKILLCDFIIVIYWKVIDIILVQISGVFNLHLYTPSHLNMAICIVIKLMLLDSLRICMSKSLFPYIKGRITYYSKYVVLSLNIFCTTIIFLIGMLNRDNSYSLLVTLLIPLLVLLHTSVVRMFVSESKMFIALFQSKIYKNQIEIIKASENNIQHMRHDLKNHILVLNSMLSEKKYDEAAAYLNNIESHLYSKDEYSKSGNFILDSLLNYKLRSINNNNNVHISCTVTVPEHMEFESFDITTIIGNILDNASDALALMDDTEKKELILEIKYNRCRLMILAKNTYNGVVNVKNSVYISSKSNDDALHGLGIKSITSAVKKYNGHLDITHDSKFFTATVMLYEKSDNN